MRLTALCAGLASDWRDPTARLLRSLLRAFGARGHETLAWEPAASPALAAELRACGAAPLRAFAADYRDLQRHTFPTMRGQELTLWLVRTLATTQVCLVDARLAAELARKVGQLTATGLLTLLYDPTGAIDAGGADWLEAIGAAGYSAVLTGDDALTARYAAAGARRVVTLAPAAEPPTEAVAAAPEYDLVLLAEGATDTPALLALAELARALPGRRLLLAGDGDGDQGDAAIDASGIERESPCGRRSPAAVYPLARLALHVPAAPPRPSARPIEALAHGAPVVSLDSTAALPGVSHAADLASLAAAADRLLTDEPARRALAARGQAAVLADHSSDARAAALEALIADLRARQ